MADQTEEGAREEAEAVIYGAVRDVLEKTGVKAKEIDILIINCSLFSPTPSLCAMVTHHFQMRHDVLSFNLSGMGCSAGLVSIDLAKRLLESRPRSRALVVSTENLTQAFYHGNDRAFLLQNTLFRCGGAAVLLSNRVQDGLRAKFKLLHVVRTQVCTPPFFTPSFPPSLLPFLLCVCRTCRLGVGGRRCCCRIGCRMD